MSSRGGTNPFIDFRYALLLARLIRRVGPTIVHNVTAEPIIYGTMAARMARVSGIVNAITGLGYAFTSPERSRWLSGIVRAGYRSALCAANSRTIVQNNDDRIALEFTRNITTSSRIFFLQTESIQIILRHYWKAS
jgi:hypothetical protein